MQNKLHRLTRSRLLRAGLLSVLMAALGGIGGNAVAAFPDHPVRLIVPFPAGGPTDAAARAVAQQLAMEIGQPVVIDNRGGAGGVIATEAAAAAAPDGYTLFFATTGALAINPALYRNFRLDVMKAFEPVGIVGATNNVLVVPADQPIQTVADLIAAAKQNPGKLTFGSAGNGSSNHLSGEMLKTMAGINIVHVPYKGSGAAMIDLLAGRLSFMFDTPGSIAQYVSAGKLRALGATGARRMAALPQVPTIAESGLPGFEVTAWFGVVAPKGTPPDVVRQLNAAVNKSMAADAVRKQMALTGIEVMTDTPPAFGSMIASDMAKWTKVVKDSGAAVD